MTALINLNGIKNVRHVNVNLNDAGQSISI